MPPSWQWTLRARLAYDAGSTGCCAIPVVSTDWSTTQAGPLDRLSLADWRTWLDSHLTGAFLCTRSALPALRAAGGAIVNIASTRAEQSEPHTEPYAAAKGGLVALTHALAISEGPAVRVNAISPGWIATDAWRKPSARRAPKLSRRDHTQHPVGRVGVPQDIASLAVFLLGPHAGFVTGQNFVVDGGMSRKMQYAWASRAGMRGDEPRSTSSAGLR